MKKTIDEMVSVKYGDYSGLIEADGFNGPSLHDICKDIGFNLERFFPIAFNLGQHSIKGIGRSDSVLLTVYAVDKKKAGDSFDEIESYMRKSQGNVQVISHRADKVFRFSQIF